MSRLSLTWPTRTESPILQTGTGLDGLHGQGNSRTIVDGSTMFKGSAGPNIQEQVERRVCCLSPILTATFPYSLLARSTISRSVPPHPTPNVSGWKGIKKRAGNSKKKRSRKKSKSRSTRDARRPWPKCADKGRASCRIILRHSINGDRNVAAHSVYSNP